MTRAASHGAAEGGVAANADTVLEVVEIDTYYGKSHILHGVSLNVRRGELVLVLGRNGAGKTTTMRSVLGLTPPRRGRITLFGEESTKQPPHVITGRGVGYVPEGRRIFPHLTVEENLLLSAGKRSGQWDVDAIYELFPRLQERRRYNGSQLSGGEQQMLAIARALVLNPELLVLDEPSQGLAPLIVRDLMAVCRKLADQGRTIVLVEQNVHAALRMAHRCYLLNNGHLVFSGSADELQARPDVMSRYLGGAA